MLYDTATDDISTLAPAQPAAAPAAPAGLPAGIALVERATSALRAYLRDRGLDHYTVFHSFELDLDDLDQHLPRLDPHARWQPLPLLPGGDQPAVLDVEEDRARRTDAGVLHLPRHQFVLARWHWFSDENCRNATTLAAAPDVAAHAALRHALVDLRRRPAEPTWEILRNGFSQETRPRAPMSWDDILLAPPVESRLRAEVAGFFAPAVAELYRGLGVPYRRGVLMHGAPGNGKTSIVRAIGANMPHVYAMILRPNHVIGDEQLAAIFRRWREHAPALLVLEDLDHLLADYINLSHFLNQLDGIAGPPTGGLLLVATTNHPEKLDPAINNRPGRFDVVIEIPGPDAAQRDRFFRKALADLALPADTIEALVAETAGLSFSHLHEVVRLSGLLAINENAAARTADHLRAAARLVADGDRSARFGFPSTPELPFGLAQFRRRG